MKFECKSGNNYRSLFVSFKFPFVSKTFRLYSTFYNTPETWVHGYSSRTLNGRYVLFHDYDSLSLHDVCEELRALQCLFKLSDYFVFALDRENSYHAVCIDTFTLAEAYNIQKTTSCDLAFIHSLKRLKTKEWVLRWGEKGNRKPPEFIGCIPSSHNIHTKSTAHAAFLKKLGIPSSIFNGGKWDGLKELGFVDYNTANRVKGG